MTKEHASIIATSKQPPLSIEQAVKAVDVLLLHIDALTPEETAGLEKLQYIIKFHADRTLDRLLNGFTQANYSSLLSALKEYCETEYNDWLKNNVHTSGDIEQRVACVRQVIDNISKHEERGIEYVTTEDFHFFTPSSRYPLCLPSGTSVRFRAGRWVYQRKSNTTAIVIPSNKVRRLKPDCCRK